MYSTSPSESRLPKKKKKREKNSEKIYMVWLPFFYSKSLKIYENRK